MPLSSGQPRLTPPASWPVSGPIALDEVQRAPELFLAIKADVDRNRKPGRYLLTGSANVLMLPKLSESLAGRMEILPLWPLSQGEIIGKPESFIDTLFTDKPIKAVVGSKGGPVLIDRILRGGYPEAHRREAPSRRRAWFNSYISTILQRDVRDLANIDGHSAMPRLLTLLASRVGSLLNQLRGIEESGHAPDNAKTLHGPLGGDLPGAIAAGMVGQLGQASG